jgi:hypothetical protein
MNYVFLSDCLWYFGHIMTGSSIFIQQNNYYLALSLVIFGQFITIISRPISRLKNIEKVTCIEELTNESNECNV